MANPLASSRCPLRIVTRLQPSSCSARRCPPGPSSCTVRARKRRRSLPRSPRAAARNNALTGSVSSTAPSSRDRHSPPAPRVYQTRDTYFCDRPLGGHRPPPPTPPHQCPTDRRQEIDDIIVDEPPAADERGRRAATVDG